MLVGRLLQTLAVILDVSRNHWLIKQMTQDVYHQIFCNLKGLVDGNQIYQDQENISETIE